MKWFIIKAFLLKTKAPFRYDVITQGGGGYKMTFDNMGAQKMTDDGDGIENKVKDKKNHH